MKKNDVTKKSLIMEENERVLARQLCRQLTDDEIQQVSGGKKRKGRCVRTSYPTMDVRC